MRLTGHGWGTSAASYDIELSDANQTNFTRRVNGLTRYQNSSGVNGPPVAFIFNTAFGNNPGFWVDDVTLGLIEVPDDPNLELALAGDLFGVLPVDSSAVTNVLQVQNTGFTQSLVISNAVVSGDDAMLYTVKTAFPVTIEPGNQAGIEVVFNPPSASRQFSAKLALACNDPSTPIFNVNLNATRLLTGAQMLLNSDLEAAPFAQGWVTGSNVVRQSGFAPNSSQAVRLVGEGQRLGQNVVSSSDWHLEAYFAVADSAGTTNEAFSIYITTISDIFNTGASRLRLRYQEGQFWYAGGVLPELGTLRPSLDANGDGDFNDPGDRKNVYHLRITGHGWGWAGSTADIELSEANSPYFSRLVAGLAINSSGGTPTSMAFDTLFGGNQGFWVDDARFIIGLPGPQPPWIRSFTLQQGSFTIEWTSEPDAVYRVLYSTNLINWSDSRWAPLPSQGATTVLTDSLNGNQMGYFRVQKD